MDIFPHACWDLLEGDNMKVFYQFHLKDNFEKSLNVTFIALIPKKLNAIDIKDFNLLGLVGVVFTKVWLKFLEPDCDVVKDYLLSSYCQ